MILCDTVLDKNTPDNIVYNRDNGGDHNVFVTDECRSQMDGQTNGRTNQ